jgi:hypothetical protein
MPPALLATAAQLATAQTVHLVGFGYNDAQLPKGFGVKRGVRVPIGAVKRSAADSLTQFEALTGFHADYEFVARRKVSARTRAIPPHTHYGRRLPQIIMRYHLRGC